MATKIEKDAISGTETTGHEWDGIKELNTPLPRWWLWTFYASVVWAIGYWIVYPAIPLVDTHTKGMIGYSSRAEVAQSIEEAKAAQSVWVDRIRDASLEAIQKSPELTDFAMAGGRSAFAVNCSQCHGAGAAGFPGYPNLNDDDWLWGGTIEEIAYTIRHGIRNELDEDSRYSEMPAYGRDEILDREQIADVVEHVLLLSGQDHDAAAAGRGAEVWAEQCAAATIGGYWGPGDRRAEPRRCRLALRRRQGNASGDGLWLPVRRDAALGHPTGRSDDQAARRLCARLGRR